MNGQKGSCHSYRSKVYIYIICILPVLLNERSKGFLSKPLNERSKVYKSVTVLLNERSKGRRLRLTLFARQAEECYLCIPTFCFPCFSRCVEKHWKQHGPIFSPFLPHSSHLRCSQLSRLREEFVRLTFLTARAFSPRFSCHTLALLLNLSLSHICPV